MKITKSHLRSIIREELSLLAEEDSDKIWVVDWKGRARQITQKAFDRNPNKYYKAGSKIVAQNYARAMRAKMKSGS